MTVLGEFVLPQAGAAWTQTLIGALDTVGVQEKAARQAISRTSARGWLSSERVGRQTRWHLTDRAVDLLTSGAQRIYGFGTGSEPWDQRWLVVLASIPEIDRDRRHRMSVELTWAGFGSLRNGTWISPRADREADAARLLESLNVDATLFRAEIGSIGRGEDLVAEAWDLPALRKRYDSLLADTARIATTPREETIGDLTHLVHAWRQFPFADPELPGDLLPTDWPARIAVDRFASCRAALRPSALRWWQEAEAEASANS